MTNSIRTRAVVAVLAGWNLATVPAVLAHVQLGATLDADQEVPAPFVYKATIDTAQEVPTPFLFTAALDTAQEVTPPTVGNPAPTGTAKFALNPDKTVRYEVTVQNLSGAPTTAEIDEGAPGVDGPMIVALDFSNLAAGKFSGTTAALSDPQVVALVTGAYYVNVSTGANASGEYRGQIGGIAAASGTAKFALNADKTVTYSVTIQDLSGLPLAAHIHAGAVGTAGPVLVALDPSSITGTGGTFSGTTTGMLTDAQITALKAGELYFNIHTALNIGGEARGQITTVVPAGLPGGSASFVLDLATRTVQYSFTTTNLSGPATQAHLHEGAVGQAGPVKVALSTSGGGETAALETGIIRALIDGGLYINVHTDLNPGGEIRGQVHVQGGADTCSCKTLSRKAFLKCVNGKIKLLPKDDKKSADVKALKKAIKLSSCGRPKVSKKSIACCLVQTPVENIVIGKICAPLTAKACTKKGGTSLGTGTSCLPTNPCVPPASPSGAFLDGLQF